MTFRSFVRSPIAASVGAAIILLGCSTAALAVSNPIVAKILPVGPHGARGNVSFFHVANDVIVNVVLEHSRPGTQSIGIHRGTCAHFAPRASWYVDGVVGRAQETRFHGVALRSFLGHALVVHATRVHSSRVIGCANIR